MASATKTSSTRAARRKPTPQHDLEAFRDIADDVIESDFVPYACLIDPVTTVTKDGELLQIIKITGLGFDARGQGDLRQAIRAAIKKHIPGDDYAIWMHTLRRRQSMLGRTHFPDAFSGSLDEAWRAQHPTSASFINELYISIVKAGENTSLRDRKTLRQSVWARRDLNTRLHNMDTRLKELTDTTYEILTDLKPYGAKLLTLVEREGIYYSEQLEFLEKLINLEERPMQVPTRDLSQVLTSGEITFGFNAMEVRTADDHRRFAAILSLKEYKESTLPGIDKFLEIPCELIVSQCFDFVGATHARDAYEKQAEYLRISGDKELAKWMELDRFMQHGISGDMREFGEQQTSVFLIAPSINQLEANIRLVQRSLARIGMVMVREDLRFEDCYWAQLPANFTFIARKNSVDTEHIAGFANLQSAAMGNANGSAWGAPISLFTTLQDTPYFFNFQRGSSAHTILLGKSGSGRSSFTHFLMAQTRKLPVSIWALDTGGRMAPAVTAMGGKVLTPGTTECKLNPLQMPESPANREFLALWLSTLIDPYGAQLNKSSLAFFQSLIDAVLKLPRHDRRLSALLPSVREADPMLAQSFARYCAGGEFGELFDMPEDNFATHRLVVWNISRYMGNPATQIPLCSYLLQRLTAAVNGQPTLLVLEEGFRILDTPLFGPRAAAWLDHLAQQNTGCLMSTAHPEESGSYNHSPAIAAKAATVFAMPDRDPVAEYAMGFGLSEAEMASLAFIDARQRQLFMKRGSEGVILKMDLGTLSSSTLATLSGRSGPASTKSPADMLAELMGYQPQAV